MNANIITKSDPHSQQKSQANSIHPSILPSTHQSIHTIMSFLSQLNSPAMVASTAGVVALVFPTVSAFCSTAAPLSLLQAANAAAYALNCAAVSVPGRIDGQEQDDMARGRKKSDKDDSTYQAIYSPGKGRTLLAPAGWAFAIWGPIYLGEAVFAGVQFLSTSEAVTALLPAVTAPFVAANIFQSLWCASFRPSYMQQGSSWHKYVSVGMLGGTALCLSQVHAAAAASSWFFLPLTMHFGWTTAATLVNLNGSLAASDAVSDPTVIAAGHASTVLATALGVGVTLAQTSPAYGLTIAWALAACADGMKKRRQQQRQQTVAKGMRVQQTLCWIGSGLCAAAAAVSWFGGVGGL